MLVGYYHCNGCSGVLAVWLPAVAQYGADLFETTAAPVTGLASMTSNAAAAKAAIAAIKYNGGSTNMEGGIAGRQVGPLAAC